MDRIQAAAARKGLCSLGRPWEVRAAAFTKADTEIDADMVAIAETIIKRRSGHFDPATFRDRYQEALRELIEAKMKGLPVTPSGANLTFGTVPMPGETRANANLFTEPSVAFAPLDRSLRRRRCSI